MDLNKYLTITSMMLTILLLFQSTQVIREYVNRNGQNEFVSENVKLVTAEEIWAPAELSLDALLLAGDPHAALTANDTNKAFQQETRRIVLVAKGDEPEVTTVRHWASLTKRQLLSAAEIPDAAKLQGLNVEAVLVMGTHVANDADVQKVCALNRNGVSVVFCSLPEMAVIESSEELRTLMGIRSITQEQQNLTALWQFKGVLLGGDVIYYPDDADTLNGAVSSDDWFSAPWFRLNYGTKTYMSGMISQSLRAEYLPPLLWRTYVNGSYVFTVNGGFMSDIAAMGFLETFMYDKDDYALYPVVNAQSLSITGFPTFATENNTAMQEYYGRNQYGLESEVLLPEMVALAERTGYSLTSYAAPQLDYSDDALPDDEMMSFFLRQLRFERIEIGMTTRQVNSDLPLADKLAADRQFLKDAGMDYHFNAMYVDDLAQLHETAEDPTVHTVVSMLTDTLPVVGFANNDTTIQTSLVDMEKVGYRDIMRRHSLETLLAYANATIDLTHVLWPETTDDDWNYTRERITSNINTYWNDYGAFDRMTASRSDERVRNFLACEVNSTREGNRLHLETSTDDAWLILRLHGEKIHAIQNASYIELEPNFFLIHVPGKKAEITLGYAVVYSH